MGGLQRCINFEVIYLAGRKGVVGDRFLGCLVGIVDRIHGSKLLAFVAFEVHLHEHGRLDTYLFKFYIWYVYDLL